MCSCTSLTRDALFWAAFNPDLATRRNGGRPLDKPVADGGLELGRFAASGVPLAVMAGLVLPQRAGQHPA